MLEPLSVIIYSTKQLKTKLNQNLKPSFMHDKFLNFHQKKNYKKHERIINYSVINFMSQTMKLLERVIEHLLRHETTSENQFCFMSG